MSEHQQRDQRLTSIEERVARLEQTSDTNAGVFSDSLQLAELCIQALQRAFDDQLAGSIKTIEVEGMKKVNFKAYLMDAMEMRVAASKVELGASTAPVARVGDTVVFEFGG